MDRDLTNLDQEILRDFYYLILTKIILAHSCFVHGHDRTNFGKSSVLACDSSNFRANGYIMGLRNFMALQ